MFSPNMFELKHKRTKKLKLFLMILLEQKINLNTKQINYGSIKEENFIINLCKNG